MTPEQTEILQRNIDTRFDEETSFVHRVNDRHVNGLSCHDFRRFAEEKSLTLSKWLVNGLSAQLPINVDVTDYVSERKLRLEVSSMSNSAARTSTALCTPPIEQTPNHKNRVVIPCVGGSLLANGSVELLLIVHA